MAEKTNPNSAKNGEKNEKNTRVPNPIFLKFRIAPTCVRSSKSNLIPTKQKGKIKANINSEYSDIPPQIKYIKSFS